MATRSLIAVFNEKKIHFSYIHFDGDLIREKIKNYYNSFDKCMNLIRLGDMPLLPQNLQDAEPYNDSNENFFKISIDPAKESNPFFDKVFDVIFEKYGHEIEYLNIWVNDVLYTFNIKYDFDENQNKTTPRIKLVKD